MISASRFSVWLVPIAAASLLAGGAAAAEPRPTPVIYDSDIGDDIDDTWALTALLKSPELDLRLVVAEGETRYRAKLFGRLLATAGRTDVPIGLGVGSKNGRGRQTPWVEGYQLESYPGKVHADGVAAIIKLIMESDEPVTVIAVGPTANIAEALKREPRIAENARFVGMHGSIRKGYGGKNRPDREYNVKACPEALQAVFAAPWTKTITPLDTCGVARVGRRNFARVRDSSDPLLEALMENVRLWEYKESKDQVKESSVLFDTVAVYLAATDGSLCSMQELPLRVTDDGRTLVSPKDGHKVRVAMDWKDLQKYEKWLVERLLSPTVKPRPRTPRTPSTQPAAAGSVELGSRPGHAIPGPSVVSSVP